MAEPRTEFVALLALARRGDAGAMSQLVRHYEPEIRLAARVRLGPALRPLVDSMDVVQSVHHSLIRGLLQDKFDITCAEQLLALAVTLVRNKVARHWRRLQRQRRLPAQAAENRGRPEDDPAQAAQYHDQVRHLCRNLNETERRLVELRLQGHSTAEVARRLGLNADVLRVRLSRLRRRLEAGGLLAGWL
jgi:RNA polymerase sigma-70 factor (ECF subfamily)